MERLWDDIHYTCQWGKGERWGKWVIVFDSSLPSFDFLNL